VRVTDRYFKKIVICDIGLGALSSFSPSFCAVVFGIATFCYIPMRLLDYCHVNIDDVFWIFYVSDIVLFASTNMAASSLFFVDIEKSMRFF
uniref:CASP-like protein n=1 Tax=Romanomermis culicivorax TaxID=13658 RepID=A0A915HUF1_ROMCU